MLSPPALLQSITRVAVNVFGRDDECTKHFSGDSQRWVGKVMDKYALIKILLVEGKISVNRFAKTMVYLW